MPKIKDRESLDKYIEYFDPKYHKHYRLSFLVTLKKLVLIHLRKQGYKRRDLLVVFRCNVTSIKNLEESKNELADIDNWFQDNWKWAICSQLKPVRKINSLATHGNQHVGFEMCLLHSDK
jgi:hypothetical protein